jgi:hypothetical protein
LKGVTNFLFAGTLLIDVSLLGIGVENMDPGVSTAAENEPAGVDPLVGVEMIVVKSGDACCSFMEVFGADGSTRGDLKGFTTVLLSIPEADGV